MKLKEVLNDFCVAFTGKTAINFDSKELGNKLTVAGLESVRLIVGYDRIKRQLPDAYYPAIVLEPIGGIKELQGDFKDGTLELWLQIGVKSDDTSGALFGTASKLGVVEIVDSLSEALMEKEYFTSSVQNLIQIEDLGETTTEGLFSGYRFYSLKVTYRVCDGLRGFQ